MTVTTTPAYQTCTVADLTQGDCLLSLAGVAYPQFVDSSSRPVIVISSAQLMATTGDGETFVHQVDTSIGTLYATASTPALIAPATETVGDRTVLLISRRPSLHTSLISLGTPLIRRTPLDTQDSVPAVTAEEWNAAPLIVVDGYLSRTTLRSMWQRGDLAPRRQIIMIGTNPDDASVYERSTAAYSQALLIFPYDIAQAKNLFEEMTNIDRVHSDILFT